jgi:hypothetical protein
VARADPETIRGAPTPALSPLALEPPPPPTSATWPLALGVHALIGVEPHDRGNPIAFGFGGELLWRGKLGGFATLLASEGTPILVPPSMNVQRPSFGDRISVPFGLAARPLLFFISRDDYWGRLLAGIGVQLGITIENLRTSDDNATTAGLHAALSVDVPLWGGLKEGGVTLRLAARLLFTPEVRLDQNAVFEPAASGQLLCGLAYYP